jgi:hypothetical protein
MLATPPKRSAAQQLADDLLKGFPSSPLPPPPGFSPHRGPPIPLAAPSTTDTGKAHTSKYGYTVRW